MSVVNSSSLVLGTIEPPFEVKHLAEPNPCDLEETVCEPESDVKKETNKHNDKHFE